MSSGGGFKYVETTRVSRTQKRRDAKATKKAEQSKRIEEAEKLDEHKDRRIEEENLKRILDRIGLQVYDIDADGDCLYRAVEHQLNLADDAEKRLTFQEIRRKTSEHMLENVDNFKLFLLNDQGDLMGDEEYRNYCSKIANTKEWGGHLELTAISQFTRKPIHIYQASSASPIIIEPTTQTESHKLPILLSFHKHLYHLGQHYNSLVKVGH